MVGRSRTGDVHFSLPSRAGSPSASLQADPLSDDEIEAGMATDPDAAPDTSHLAMIPDPRGIRERLAMTQQAFAGLLGIPLGTLRNWEQGRTRPDPAAVALFRILDTEPKAALRALRRRAA